MTIADVDATLPECSAVGGVGFEDNGETQYIGRLPIHSTVDDGPCPADVDATLPECTIGGVIGSPVKRVAIGHATVQAAKPRSAISPILFGTGVSLDHSYASRLAVFSRVFHTVVC